MKRDSSLDPVNPSTVRQQQVAIVYNGRVNVLDITELQARAIIWLASREMDQRINTGRSNITTVPLHYQLYSPPGLSLKRSLQRFLQKRKRRAGAATPYNK
ncbi:hypothetical protein K2173_014933 [Erythroxylum novogranatense]|uniref:Protein TIFY n=1 Tax=Erythroxylum novogranatense TaxID=1862640 RepID=A0AAV8TU63_9ROSI|nr:hypothetical protein K2173_014933 [Erythroxylum novogranatense]